MFVIFFERMFPQTDSFNRFRFPRPARAPKGSKDARAQGRGFSARDRAQRREEGQRARSKAKERGKARAPSRPRPTGSIYLAPSPP